MTIQTMQEQLGRKQVIKTARNSTAIQRDIIKMMQECLIYMYGENVSL